MEQPRTYSYKEYLDKQVERTLVKIDTDSSDKTRYLLQQLLLSCAPCTNSRVLCVGCRNAFELNCWQSLGLCDVTGIDLQSSDSRIVVMDMHNMTFADSSFDILYSCHSLEHALDARKAASEFIRVLKPGGVLVIEVPSGFLQETGHVRVKNTDGSIIEVPVDSTGFQADVWDFGSLEEAIGLFPGTEPVWSETGKALDNAQQTVFRFILKKHAAQTQLPAPESIRLDRMAKETALVPQPRYVSLPLAAQCNYRCSFCEINGTEAFLKRAHRKYQSNFLSLLQAKIFEQVVRGAAAVDFGGLSGLGEPLLAPDFSDICCWVREINPACCITITTNASLLTAEKSDLLAALRPINITFSLHAASRPVYERVMGKHFEKTVANIAYFCNVTKGISGVETAINFGIGKHNRIDALPMVELARNLGIGTLHVYAYYKSPNKFADDYSLYSEPEAANAVLTSMYEYAARLGQQMAPPAPPFIKQPQPSSKTAPSFGCSAPTENFILKADPFNANKAALGVCNRIMLFHLDLTKPIENEDLVWAWQHPIMQALRTRRDEMEVCRLCRDPGTGVLRCLDNDKYLVKRDQAVFSDLRRFYHDRFSPNGSIELMLANIYSI